MDELRGPTIQVILHIKEGLGFGFLKNPFLVSGSLNGYLLDTDPVIPCHAPIFDAELVWEADKRRFRNLRVQNVPIKLEVYTTCSQGRKNKIGYLMLSLLGAQPCPANKPVNIKNAWHRLLGVKSEGKCCQPQLLLSLTIEDRISTPTPRNELRMFHSNEAGYFSPRSDGNIPTLHPALQNYDDYMTESQKTVSSADLAPKLLCDEGLIQIGRNTHLFTLSFVIASAENVDMLMTKEDNSLKETINCFVTYSIFTNNIMTDRVNISIVDGVRNTAQFNQRTSLRLCTDLSSLSRYFSECPYVIAKFCSAQKDLGVCSMDLRKLVPTENLNDFLNNFCDNNKSLTIHERCYILCSEQITHRKEDRRKPYIDIEMSLKYAGTKSNKRQKTLNTTRSATELVTKKSDVAEEIELQLKSESCTQIIEDIEGVAYTNITAKNTNRYKNATGDATVPSTELAEVIKQMYDTFLQTHNTLQTSRSKASTADVQVQWEPIPVEGQKKKYAILKEDKEVSLEKDSEKNMEDLNNEKSQEKEKVNLILSASERDSIMKKYVEELEDWKERQQELYKCQLQRKEEYHLEILSTEWTKRRTEMESRLSTGIEQCRTLAADLSRATEDFKLRGFRNTEREKKLHEAKRALEQHYTAKYQELREASQKMEDDMLHQVRLKDMCIKELEISNQGLETRVKDLMTRLKDSEKEAEHKYSGLTKEQTASLIQEMRCLEEKLENALQSKAFFKEQWGRAVRDSLRAKSDRQRHVLTDLKSQRKILADMGLDTIDDPGKFIENDMNDGDKLKTHKFLEIFANIPEQQIKSNLDECTSGLDIFSNQINIMPKNSKNEKVNKLIKKRDELVANDSPDEDQLTRLNQEIRNLLLNYEI